MNWRQPAIPLRRPACLIATVFGSGLFPKAPGTMGSLASIPLAMPLIWLSTQLNLAPSLILSLAALAAYLIGWWASAIYMRQGQVNHDPSEIVIDELAGIWLVMAWLPLTWWGITLAFILFRFFDILKPWPINWCDRHIKGAFGVMWDDIAAAIIALILYHSMDRLIASQGYFG